MGIVKYHTFDLQQFYNSRINLLMSESHNIEYKPAGVTNTSNGYAALPMPAVESCMLELMTMVR